MRGILDNDMAYTAEKLVADDNFLVAILHCASEMLSIYHESPRIASIFAAQQRWMMAHVGFALHYGFPDDPKRGLYSGRFVDFIVKNKIASRNTAAAFVQEMLAYRFLREARITTDRRTRLLEPTEIAEEHFIKWLVAHLLILDSLDDGRRGGKVLSDPSTIRLIQPMIAKAIIENDAVREPGASFSLFNWTNSGGLVMDYLMTKLGSFSRKEERAFIGPLPLREIREQFMISNTHLKRLLAQAAEMGSVGWSGPARKGDFWLSRSFVMEYWGYQAAKFAAIDAAAEAVLGPVSTDERQTRLTISTAP